MYGEREGGDGFHSCSVEARVVLSMSLGEGRTLSPLAFRTGPGVFGILLEGFHLVLQSFFLLEV